MDRQVEVNSKPIEYTLSIIGGKWKIIIMFWLWKCGTLRYNELKKSINQITHKMLSSQLSDLEADHIVIRKDHHQIPPKVEYSLSPKGLSLMPVLSEMCNWGMQNMNEEQIPTI